MSLNIELLGVGSFNAQFGQNGLTGPQGPAGERGPQGERGLQGIQGVKGDKGDQGERGLQGIQGIQGERGLQGIQGIQGERGLQGDKGDKGDKGDRGDQGIQGIQGIQGERGFQGDPGPKGDTGDTGVIGADAPLFYDAGTKIVSISDSPTFNHVYVYDGSGFDEVELSPNRILITGSVGNLGIDAAGITFSDTSVQTTKGIPEAPLDGQIYARQDSGWVVAPNGSGIYLPLSGGAMTGSITSIGTTYDTEMSGELFGVQLSSDHTKGTTVEFNGLNTYDGESHMLVTPTGLTFPDATIQTTAFPGFSGYATESFVTSQGYITQGTADGLYYSISNPSGFITSGDLAGYATESFVTGQGYITQGTANGLYYSISNPSNFLAFDANNRLTFGNGTNPDPTPLPGRFWFQSDKFRYSTSTSSLGNVIASEGWVTSQGYITSSALTPYAQLAGATFTGKINLASIAGAQTPTLNLGSTVDPNATNAVSGDFWISNAASPKVSYKVGSSTYYCTTNNLTNTFSSPQVFDTTSNTLAAVRITQKGTFPALVVEDATNPDTTAFVVDQNGAVGVGVDPSTFSPTNKVEVVGNLKATAFVNGTGPTYNVKAIQTHSGNPDTHELLVSVNGSTYRVGMRFVSTP